MPLFLLFLFFLFGGGFFWKVLGEAFRPTSPDPKVSGVFVFIYCLFSGFVLEGLGSGEVGATSLDPKPSLCLWLFVVFCCSCGLGWVVFAVLISACEQKRGFP